MYVGWDTTFDLIATHTEIDGEVHHTFHRSDKIICGRSNDIKDEFRPVHKVDADADET